MTVTMRIAAGDATPAERAAETEALLRLMRGLPGLDARRAEDAPPGPGQRGGAGPQDQRDLRGA
jgi:hypothetical protein